jgi:transposase
MASTELAPERLRRSYSRALKAQIIAQCGDPKKSVAGVALAHGINANIIHKWLRLRKRGQLAVSESSFVAVPMTPPREPASPQTIRVDIIKSGVTVTVNWPTGDGAQCAAWLRDWLR